MDLVGVEKVKLFFKNWQKWISHNRLLVWWLVFIPLILVILFLTWGQLRVTSTELANPVLSLQYKIFNSAPLIMIARVVLIAIGLVIIMICLLFPILQVSKEGVQWSKELEDELTRASSEITGEEISHLVDEEAARWLLVYGWIKQCNSEKIEKNFLMREFLSTVWEAFNDYRISLSLVNHEGRWALIHPLLPRLIPEDQTAEYDDETTLRLQLHLNEDVLIYLYIYAEEGEGFSIIDERFMLVLGEIFFQEALHGHTSVVELLTYFDRILLTFVPQKV